MTTQENLIGFEQAGIGSLLRDNFFRVPANQREYAWTDREIGQLFSDIARAIDLNSDHFLGTIVTIPRPNGSLEVVDGQQRLATTAILLSAIRIYMKEINEDILVEAVGGFLTGIDRTNRARVPRLTLNSLDHELFRAIVTNEGTGDLPKPSQESHELLILAYDRAREYIRNTVAALDPLHHGDHLNTLVNFLESRARVVLLRVPDDSDAYRMFETLNDRGLRTSQADLIKNYLFGRARERMEEVHDHWAFMRGTLDTIEEDDLTVTFLRHALIAQHGYLREAEVYNTVQQNVRSAQAAATFATTLDHLATSYAATFNPEHETWNARPASIREAIRVLNILSIRPLRPAVLAVAARIDSLVDPSEALRFLLSLGVRLLIASTTRSGAVETSLANAAHQVWKGEISSAAELKAELSPITPSDAQFQAAFEKARVYNTRLARYYLRSLETASSYEAEPWFIPTDDATIINLEHVLPRRPTGNWPQFTDEELRLHCNRLGNLALIRASDNSALGSAAFEEKKPFFAHSPYALTKEVAEYPEWTVQAISRRQERMAQLANRAWPVA